MINLLTIACLVGAAGSIIGGIVSQVAKAGPPIATWVAAFLFCFGLGKGLVAVRKLVELKAVPAGGPDPRASFSNHFLFWAYIATKFAVWLVGWSVGTFLLYHPEAFIAR